MKKLSVLMSALVMALAFVACEKDETPAPAKLAIDKDAIEVVIDAEEAVEVEIAGGVAPYTAEVAGVAEDATYDLTAEVKENKISVVATTKEDAPAETEDGNTDGEETVDPIVVTVKDAKGEKVEFTVTVEEAEETPETPEGEE